MGSERTRVFRALDTLLMVVSSADRELSYADDVPLLCQQFACNEPVATWCPLCRACFCDSHDELYPVRRHDCIRGKAEPHAAG